jgi:LacI family transcriptional regulator
MKAFSRHRELHFMGRTAKPKRPGLVTIVDVAERAGVSISSVSRAINGSAHVDPEKKTRIDAAILELGFAPAQAARALAGRGTRTIGLLVSVLADDFFVPMLRGIERTAQAAGYELLVKTTGLGRGEGRAFLGERNADGFLLFADSADRGTVAALEGRGLPVVLLYAEPPPGIEVPSVKVENVGGAREAVLHLVDAHARRRIACLTGPDANHDAEERLQGYRMALEARGIPLMPELLAIGDFSAPRAAASIRSLLARGVAFDAVFACDDGAAMGVVSALREAGIAVGPEVSVVGFDDQSFAASASLATVFAPTEEVGAEGVRLLLSRIEKPEAPPGAGRVFPTAFVPRASCGCGQGGRP